MTNGQADVLAELERLQKLRSDQVISEDEFLSLKRQVLLRGEAGTAATPNVDAVPNNDSTLKPAREAQTPELGIDSIQSVGFLGVALLSVGVFTPIVHLPIVGSINYIYNGRGDGIIVLLLTLAAGLCVFFRKPKVLAGVTMLISLVCLYTFVRLDQAISNVHSSVGTELKDNPFRGLAEAVVSTVGLGWGWAILGLGVASLVVCMALAWNNSKWAGLEAASNDLTM